MMLDDERNELLLPSSSIVTCMHGFNFFHTPSNVLFENHKLSLSVSLAAISPMFLFLIPSILAVIIILHPVSFARSGSMKSSKRVHSPRKKYNHTL